MLSILLKLILNVFLFIVAGFIFSLIIGKREKIIKFFINFAIFFVIPVFIFINMWTTKIDFVIAGKITVLAIVVLTSGAGLAVVFSKIMKTKYSRTCLPIFLMNSRYLAVPVNGLLLGPEGVAYAVVYDVVMTLYSATVGVSLVLGHTRGLDPYSLPMIISSVLGFILNLTTNASAPEFIYIIGKYMSMIVLPLMLFFVGYRISMVTKDTWKQASLATLFRVGGGLAVGYLMVLLLNLTGPARGVGIITSIMPSAVASYIFSEIYHADEKYAAATVSLSTLLSMIYIPLIAWLFNVR
ncbi:MAG: AEC family transporter [Elusimicrobiota bacterium]